MLNAKVLVIDDSVIIQRILQHYSTTIDISIVSAYTGLEGLNKLNTDIFDIVFLDLNLPDSDGLEIAWKIRGKEAQGTLNTVPIILLTGSNIEKFKDAKHLDACVEKPISCNDFSQIITTWVKTTVSN